MPKLLKLLEERGGIVNLGDMYVKRLSCRRVCWKYIVRDNSEMAIVESLPTMTLESRDSNLLFVLVTFLCIPS